MVNADWYEAARFSSALGIARSFLLFIGSCQELVNFSARPFFSIHFLAESLNFTSARANSA